MTALMDPAPAPDDEETARAAAAMIAEHGRKARGVARARLYAAMARRDEVEARALTALCLVLSADDRHARRMARRLSRSRWRYLSPGRWIARHPGVARRLRRLGCLIGLHIRSSGRAKRWGAGWRTVCRNCGCPLFRVDDGRWTRLR